MTVAKKSKMAESYAKAKINSRLATAIKKKSDADAEKKDDGNSQKKRTIADYY